MASQERAEVTEASTGYQSGHRFGIWLRRLWRLALAILGGVLSSLAYPREGIWPMIFISVIALLLSVRGLAFGKAFRVGYVGGFFFYLTQIEWISLYLGPVPLLALSILEAFFFGLGMAAIARVWSWLDRQNWSKPTLALWKPTIISLAISTLWVAREWVSTNLPYGGFPWSRLAMSQSESPLNKWVYFGGQALLCFLIVFICAILITSFRQARKNRANKIAAAGLGEPRLHALIAGIAIIAVFLTPTLTAIPNDAQAGTIVIAAVQGNANAGLFANPSPGSIMRNHLQASGRIKVQPLGDQIDVVVWPENASDINPLGDAAANNTIRRFIEDEIKVPLIFGTVTQRGDDLYNSSLLWMPGKGVTDWYDKKRPVPFAEYVPDRDFWYSIAPSLIGLISHGFTFGTRDGIFEVKNSKLGVLICFEIAIDDIPRELVAGGAKVILSQTNNSDFGHSDETFQQVAIAKLRAIETGRAVINDSTVGVSAVFSPDGTTLAKLPTFEPGVMVTRVPLRTAITPAMAFGPAFDLAANLISLSLIIFTVSWPRLTKRRKSEVTS